MLTDSDHVEDILEILFQNFRLVREKGLHKWTHDECTNMDEILFRFSSKKEPYRTVQDLAGNLHHYLPEDVLITER